MAKSTDYRNSPTFFVAVWVGSKADARVIENLLSDEHAEAVFCESEETIGNCIEQGIDALIVTDEVLPESPTGMLPNWLGRPELVDLPVLLVAPGGPDAQLASRATDHFLNLLLLNRPVHLLAFKNAIRLALRTRARQLQIKELLEERDLTVERLQRLVDELARSNQDLERFSYVASHDLREPLRQIKGFANLLKRRYKEILDEDAKEYFNFISEGVDRLDALIGDLLQFSRIGKEADTSREVDLGRAAEAAVANMKSSIEESGAKIHIQPLPLVRGNRTLLVQVFQNLVGNAIKFRKDEPPEVEIGARAEALGWLVWVRDNGIGFPQESAESIFEVFHRLHGKSQYSGTGIGLAICRRAVESHGGRIWAESEPGKGSTFFFTLPAKVNQE